jgi:hypothetical protein
VFYEVLPEVPYSNLGSYIFPDRFFGVRPESVQTETGCEREIMLELS